MSSIIRRSLDSPEESRPVKAPGHDAWVLGDEPYVFIDWQGMADYAKPAG